MKKLIFKLFQKQIIKAIAKPESAVRRSGCTTRIADMYIQGLFNSPNEWTVILDHHSTWQSNNRLTEIILNRLYNEHSLKIDFKIPQGNYRIERSPHRLGSSLKLVMPETPNTYE